MLVVTATILPRLLNCNGSRFVGGLTPPATTGDDTVKKEGDAADWVVQQYVSGRHNPEDLIDCKAPNGVYITAEMIEYLDEYIKAVSRKNGTEFLKTEFENSYQVADVLINGRADLIRYCDIDQHLEIGDLKYGWGIVEPEMNWTLLSHAFGFMNKFPGITIKKVTFTIYQPRPKHYFGTVRSWSIDGNTLLKLAVDMSHNLNNLNDCLNTGEHCYKCPALITCPAARKAQLNAIESSERAYVENINNETLSFFLDHINRAFDILSHTKKAYEEMAIHRIKEGQVVNNYSVETGLSNRDWTKHVTPEWLEILTGENLTKKNLITPAQAEKIGVNKDIVAVLTERHNTNTKLIRVAADAKARKLLKKL